MKIKSNIKYNQKPEDEIAYIVNFKDILQDGNKTS